jgi:UDP-hydrolysing UDP-N-acetyl-D-glucosamine 2-epimerase
MNLCLVHVQGGEVSGSIDESARHAITKLAHYHFPSTQRAAEYIVRMGERPDSVLGVGCPSSDLARTLDRRIDPHVVNGAGAGAIIDLSKPYLLVVYHPTTTEYGAERDQIHELLEALGRVRLPSVLLWPNIDAGADRISKQIRVFRQRFARQPFLRTLTNLQPRDYLRVLAGAACAVGNSSSFVRDAGFFGTPVVLVGRRQAGRELDVHARPVEVEQEAIVAGIRERLARGRFAPSQLYGDGFVAERIAAALAQAPLYVQKQLDFVRQDAPAVALAAAPPRATA